MKIVCKKKGVRWIRNTNISPDYIVFDKRGYTTVSREVGDKLLEVYPDLAVVKSRTKDEEE